MKALIALFRPDAGRVNHPVPGAAGGVYACTDDLLGRWQEHGEDGRTRLQGELARIRAGKGGSEDLVDLRGACLIDEDLSDLDLSGADLRGADMSRANLENTRLFQADLSGAVVFQAQLDGADLTGANLHGANLDSASLVGAGVGATDLRSAILMNATLDGATLSRCDLTNADLRGASLQDANLVDAKLVDADLTRADMRGSILNRSDVTGACFDEADMRTAHVHQLKGYELARFVGADVREVDFAGAQMTRRFINDQNYIEEFRAKSPVTKRIYYLWWLTSDCGRSMTRWGSCTLIIALMFAFAFEFVAIDYGASETWYSSIYFSFVTLTTLGYGDVTPASAAAQILVTLEVIIGYLMLGGIISILSNSLARRAD